MVRHRMGWGNVSDAPLQSGLIATSRVRKEKEDGLQEDFPQEQGRREDQTVRRMPEVLHRGVGG